PTTGSERVLQSQLDLVNPRVIPAVKHFRGSGGRVVEAGIERERRDRLAQRARVAPGLAQSYLLGERRVERRELDQTPVLVQEVEEVEHIDLQRELVPAVLRDRLPDGDVEPVLGRAAAAVALHDVAALLGQARLGVDETVERLRRC